MTRKDALAELIAKVEAGDSAGFRRANRAVFSTPCQDMALQLQEEHARHAYNGSLDAAKALHDAVLPGWWWIKPDGVDAGTIRVVGPDNGDYYPSAVGRNPCPARAWLLAILRALHSRILTHDTPTPSSRPDPTRSLGTR